MAKQSRGTCQVCGKSFAKGGMVRHLSSCPERKEANLVAEGSKRKGETLHHVRIEDAWGAGYWLDLEMRGSATLADLDRYLRAIWLECCGHLSQFSVGGWAGREIPMSRRINDVFGSDEALTHIYDFGTSSETLVRPMGTRPGVPLTRHPITLMARNLPPEYDCMACGKPAHWLCLECVYEHDSPGTLCDDHAEQHPHDDYGEPMPIVNSPRVGMCGYEGPAEPPY